MDTLGADSLIASGQISFSSKRRIARDLLQRPDHLRFRVPVLRRTLSPSFG